MKFAIKDEGKFINFRPIVIISLCFGVGIFSCYLFSLLSLLIGFSVFAIITAFILYFYRKKKDLIIKISVFILSLFIVFTIGSLSYKNSIKTYEKDTIKEGRYTVQAVIKDIRYADSILLERVVITDGERVFALNTNLRAYCSYTDCFNIGNQVSFTSNIRIFKTNAYGKFNANSILENTKYFTNVSTDSVIINEKSNFNLFYFLRERIRITVFANMEKGNAALSYAMLTGDENFIESDLLSNFRYGGVAHIFAVSGLHIGVIYSVLYFVLKRIRMPWVLRCSIIFVVLFLYAGVCGFSPSSVRALVMCSVLMITSSLGFKYDRLNSVALASLIVLIINPMYLFSVGFVLSIMAVVGITLLSVRINLLLGKIKCPSKISSAISISLSAQFGTVPVLLDCFGYVPSLSIIVNLIFIPIFSVVFSIIFFSVLVACAFSTIASSILFVPNLILHVAIFPIEVIDLKVLLISGFSFGIFIVLWYALILCVSDKLNFKILPRTIISIILCVCMLAGICFTQASIKNNDLLIVGNYNSSFIYDRNNSVLISYGMPDKSDLNDFSIKNSIYKLNGLIVLGAYKDINTAIPLIFKNISVKTLYVPYKKDYLSTFNDINVHVGKSFKLGDTVYSFLNIGILNLSINGTSVLCCNSNYDKDFLGLDADLLIAYDDKCSLKGKNQIYFENVKDKISVKATGNLHIKAQNGIISIRSNVAL